MWRGQPELPFLWPSSVPLCPFHIKNATYEAELMSLGLFSWTAVCCLWFVLFNSLSRPSNLSCP